MRPASLSQAAGPATCACCKAEVIQGLRHPHYKVQTHLKKLAHHARGDICSPTPVHASYLSPTPCPHLICATLGGGAKDYGMSQSIRRTYRSQCMQDSAGYLGSNNCTLCCCWWRCLHVFIAVCTWPKQDAGSAGQGTSLGEDTCISFNACEVCMPCTLDVGHAIPLAALRPQACREQACRNCDNRRTKTHDSLVVFWQRAIAVLAFLCLCMHYPRFTLLDQPLSNHAPRMRPNTHGCEFSINAALCACFVVQTPKDEASCTKAKCFFSAGFCGENDMGGTLRASVVPVREVLLG